MGHYDDCYEQASDRYYEAKQKQLVAKRARIKAKIIAMLSQTRRGKEGIEDILTAIVMGDFDNV